jgi:hypothetical protein
LSSFLAMMLSATSVNEYPTETTSMPEESFLSMDALASHRLVARIMYESRAPAANELCIGKDVEEHR